MLLHSTEAEAAMEAGEGWVDGWIDTKRIKQTRGKR